jgi:hypothetical protein
VQSKSFVIGLSIAFRAATAHAQNGPEELVRRELLNEADAARNAGDHARALDRARRAMQIRATPSVGLIIAQEAEALSAQPDQGHLVLEALSAAENCAAQANLDPTLRNREVILVRCREVAEHMRPRVGRVRLSVQGPTLPGMNVQVNGAPVPQAVWSVDYPVVPGRVRVDAVTPDGREFHTEAEVSAGSTQTLTVVIPVAPTVGVRAETTAPPRRALHVQPPPPPPRQTHVGAWALVGTGAALTIVGSVFLGLRFSNVSERERLCPAGACANVNDFNMATAAQDNAKTYNTAGFVLAGVGVAAITAGVLWRVLGASREAPRAASSGALRWGFMADGVGAYGVVEGAL